LRSRIITFLVIILLSGLNARAQNPYIQHLTTFDDLPSNTVYQVYQDSRKFLWFATDAGVALYDGFTFTKYRKKDGLNSNDIVKIKEDSRGRVWLINLNATLNFYLNGVIYNSVNAPFLDSLEAREFFHDFVEDENRTIYFFQNYQRDIFTLDSNNTVSKFKLPSIPKCNPFTGVFFDCMSDRYISFVQDRSIYLWTLGGIYSIPGIGEMPVLVSGRHGFKAVFPAGKNKNYAVTGTGEPFPPFQVIRYFNETTEDTSFSPILVNSQFISSVFEDSDGVLWISTFDKGVLCYKNNRLIHHYDIREAQAVIQDHENNIWITSLSDGVYKISPALNRHTHYERGHFSGEGIIALSHQNKSGIWLTNGREIYLLRNGMFLTLDINKPGQTFNQLIQPDDKSLIVGEVGTHFYAVDGIHHETGQDKLQYRNISVSQRPLKKLIANQAGDEIISWNFFSLIIIPSDNLFENARYISLGERIHYTFFNTKGELLVNTKKVYLYDGDSLVPYQSFAGLNNKIITDYLGLSDSVELFNMEGDSIYLQKGEKLYNLTAAWNYPMDLQVRYMEYQSPTLFVATNRNVFICNDPLKVMSGQKVELHPVDINFRNIHDMLLEEGQLYLASDDGLTVIDEDDLASIISLPPLPYFQSILVNDTLSGKNSEILVLTGRNRIHINFSSINYSASPVTYSYQLEGLDQEWHISSGKNVLYESLPMGDYVFKLRARKPTSDWSQTINYRIRIERTVWRRPFFLTFVTLLSTGVVLLFILWRKNTEMKRKDLEHQLVLLEQRALQSMMNPHFIFNALGSIQNFLLQSKPREAGIYLSQFARLVRNNLKATNFAMIVIMEEVNRLKDYLDLEKLRLENKFEYQIIPDQKIDLAKVRIPSMIIQNFVENAIWHGIAYIDEKGMISIRFILVDENTMKIIIEDNGIGLKKAEMLSVKDGNHLKMGMAVTRKRLDLLGIKYGILTGIEITEKFPGEENPGARVTLTFPYTTSAEE
jgi:hypothetical protein